MTALLVLLLMAGQAYCEMNLPQYTQNIIDTGIINHGIEHVLPEAVTSDEYSELTSYMTAEQAAVTESLYDADEDGIYRLNETDSDRLKELDEELTVPVAKRYADKIGEKLPSDLDESDQNLRSMGLQYAAECDEEAGIDILTVQNRYMWKCGGRMLLMSLIVLVFTTGISFLAARVGATIGRDLRSSLFENVMSFSSAEISRFQTSSLITRATNDIQQVQMTATMMLRMMLFAPCICTWSIIKVWQTHAHMNFVIVTGVTAILLMVLLLFVIAMPKFKVMQSLVDALNAVSREILTGIQVIRAFGREETEEKRFDKANRDLYRNQLFVNRTMISMSPVLMIIM